MIFKELSIESLEDIEEFIKLYNSNQIKQKGLWWLRHRRRMYNNAASPLNLRWKSGGLPSFKMEKKIEETKIETVNF